MTIPTINFFNEFVAHNKSDTFKYFRFNHDGSFVCRRGKDFTSNEEGLIHDLTSEGALNFIIAGYDERIDDFDEMYVPMFCRMTGMLYWVTYSTQREYGQMMEVTVHGKEVTNEEYMKICDYANKTKTSEIGKDLLRDLLLKHRGHNVSIVSYGDFYDPAVVCLECEDCGEVILDAGLYTLRAREEK